VIHLGAHAQYEQKPVQIAVLSNWPVRDQMLDATMGERVGRYPNILWLQTGEPPNLPPAVECFPSHCVSRYCKTDSCRVAVDDLPRSARACLNFTRGSAQTQCRGRRSSALFGWSDTIPKVCGGPPRWTFAGQCRAWEWQDHRRHPPDRVSHCRRGCAVAHSRIDLHQQSRPGNAGSS
jgi:hypothetical protein